MQHTPLPKKILIIFDFLFKLFFELLSTNSTLVFLAKNSTFLVHRSVLRPYHVYNLEKKRVHCFGQQTRKMNLLI